MTSPGEVVSVFTFPYLSAGAPALGEAKGLIIILSKIKFYSKCGKPMILESNKNHSKERSGDADQK